MSLLQVHSMSNSASTCISITLEHEAVPENITSLLPSVLLLLLLRVAAQVTVPTATNERNLFPILTGLH